MPSLAEQHRAKQFKNCGKHEEMRRRRAEGSVELRKQKKEDQLMKRRNIDLSATDMQDDSTDGTGAVPGNRDQQQSSAFKNFSFEICRQILSGSDCTPEYSKAVEDLRKVLSQCQNPPVESVIKAQLVPWLVKALTSANSKIQFEAAWAVTNIVSGTSEQTMVVVDCGGIPPLAALLLAPDLHVAEQAAWALGNIAGESAQMRDMIIASGALEKMVMLIQKDGISIEFLRTLAWIFSNICRHKRPHVPIEIVEPIIPVLAWMIQHSDKQVATDSCWALSYFTDGPDERIGLTLRAGILPHIIQLLTSKDKKLAAPAMRTLGNIVTGTDDQTQAVVDSGILATIVPEIIVSSSQVLAKESCWMISNVLAGTHHQIQAVIDAGLIPLIIDKLAKGDFRTQSEAAWAITNLVTGGTKEQISQLLSYPVLPPFTKLLTCKDTKVTTVVLDGLKIMLDLGAFLGQLDALCLALEECGAVDYLEDLQQHENEEVYNRAVHMIETYFGIETDGETENKENKPDEFCPKEVPKEGFHF